MPKQIILYNLADHVTDEVYKNYVVNEKGPLLESLPSVKKFELVKMIEAGTEKIPYKYVGIMHLKKLDEFYQKDAKTQKFQDFLAKWRPMTSNYQIISGEEIY